MMLILSLLPALLGVVISGPIVSNIPVIVSPFKNYTSASPTWLTSPYFRAGNQAVISSLTGSNTTPTYTFTFSSALPGLPNLAYGIKNYRGNDYFGQEFYEIKKTGFTAATFSVSIQIYGITNLWVLNVAYLAVDPTFPHHLNSFDNVPINYTAGDIVNISVMQTDLTYYANYINYTDQAAGLAHNTFTTPYSSNSIVLFITSFWVRALFGSPPGYNPVKFHIYTGIVNESFYFWNATLETNTMVTNVHFSQIIFNSDDVQSSKKYFIVYETWINDMNGGFLEIPQEFIDNFIMGVTAFETVDGHCGFEYQWEFANATINGTLAYGVELLLSWTLTNTCGFAWSLSSIFYMQTWLCNPPYSYFNLTSGLCQTQCGGFNYQDTLNLTCEPCVNKLCYECNDPTHNLCTDCASYLFYELINGSCNCISGYFHTNNLCMPCNNASTGCLTCTYNDGANGTLAYNSTNFTCHTCNNTANYFLSGGLCQLCTLPNCISCVNLTSCAICSSPYSQSVNFLCVFCNVTGCAYCSDTDQDNCSICNSSMGYSLSGKTCQIETPKSNLLLLMILLPLLVAVCCCCLIIYCVWRRRLHDENKVQEENQNEDNLENNNQVKPYKVQSKKLQAKIQHNDTQGNELSMNEFKGINDIKVDVEPEPEIQINSPKEKSQVNEKSSVHQKSSVHEKSSVNEKSQTSEHSDFSRPSQDQQDSRGCHY